MDHPHLRIVRDKNPWHDPSSYETADAGLEGRGDLPRSAPRSYMPPHRLAQIVPGHADKPDLIEQLRQRQRDEALDRATALGFVGLSVMLLVALAIGAMLAAGRV